MQASYLGWAASVHNGISRTTELNKNALGKLLF